MSRAHATEVRSKRAAHDAPVSLGRTVSNSAALVVLDLFAKAVPLLTFPLVVRALGPTTYGKLGFAAAVTGFFGLLATPGFATYGAREIARQRDATGVRSVLSHLLGARVVFASASYLLLVPLALAQDDPVVRVLLLLSGASLLVTSLELQWVFVGTWRLWTVSLAGVLGQVAYAGIILTFVRRPDHAWVVPAATIAAGVVSAALLAAVLHRTHGLVWPRLSAHAWAEMLPVCLTLGLASAMSIIYDQIDVVMLRYFRTDAEVGLYVASYRIMGMGLAFLPILGQVFFTLLARTAREDRDHETRYLSWMGTASLGLALPIAAGGWILAAPLTALLLGSGYAGADHLMRWLMLNVVTAALASYWGARLVPNDRERQYLVAVAAGAAVNVVLNLIFIPRFGAIAAVLTTVASQAAVAATAFYLARDLPRPDLGRAVTLSVVATAVMTLGLVVLTSLARLHVVALVALGALVYGVVYTVAYAWWSRAAAAVAVQLRS